MSTMTFIPIAITVKDHDGTIKLDTFVGYFDEALKFMAQGVREGDRTSGPMPLRRAGAILASFGVAP